MQTIAKTIAAAVTGFIAAVAIGATLVLAGAAGAAAEPAPQDPAAFIQALNDEAIAVIVSPDTSPEQRRDRFRRLLTAHFDLDAIARFAMGRYWRTATPSQRGEYVHLFRAVVVESYATRFEAVREAVGAAASDGPRGQVVRVQAVSARDHLVHTLVRLPRGEPLRVGYRVRVRDGRWQIVDVIQEGISLLVTRRSEVTAVVGRRGVEALLATMRAQGGAAAGAQQAQAAAR